MAYTQIFVHKYDKSLKLNLGGRDIQMFATVILSTCIQVLKIRLGKDIAYVK